MVIKREKMTSKINVDGTEYDLKSIKDRSIIIQILKEKMADVEEQDYYEVTGDFKMVKE